MKFKEKIFLTMLALLFAGSMVFAQVKVSITIQCNIPGAQVYLNDNFAGTTSPNFTLQVFPGRYTIRVIKNGFTEFSTSVVAVQSPITIVANLWESTPQLPAPTSPSGPSPSQPPPSSAGQLIIDVGINGATVFINGTYAGVTPFQGIFQRGNYGVRISAPGYADYTGKVFIDGYTRLSISLSPLAVDYEIRLPLLSSNHPNQGNGSDRIDNGELQLYIDGNRLNRLHGRIIPGRHTMTLIYRNLRLEDTFEVIPGKPATIELSLDVRVH